MLFGMSQIVNRLWLPVDFSLSLCHPFACMHQSLNCCSPPLGFFDVHFNGWWQGQSYGLLLLLKVHFKHLSWHIWRWKWWHQSSFEICDNWSHSIAILNSKSYLHCTGQNKWPAVKLWGCLILHNCTVICLDKKHCPFPFVKFANHLEWEQNADWLLHWKSVLLHA